MLITGRRGVLRTFVLTMATGAIGVASAAAKPATAAVRSALTPPGATYLEELQQRLARAPRRRDFKSGRVAQATKPREVRALQHAFLIHIGTEKTAAIWLKRAHHLLSGELRRLAPTLHDDLAVPGVECDNHALLDDLPAS